MNITNDLQQTLARHEHYAEADPDNLNLRLHLADLYHRAGRFDAALDACERCLTLAPDHAVAQGLRASVLISQHRFAEAEQSLAALADVEEDDAALQHNLGVARFHLGRCDDARRCFEAAARQGLDDYAPNLSYLTRSLQQLGLSSEAVEACERWVEREPTHASQRHLAQLYLEDGRLDDAHRAALALLGANPEDATAHVIAGFVCSALQETELALRHFDSAIALDYHNAQAWQGLGLVHFHHQRFEEAIEAMRTVARIAPEDLGNLVTLGWARLMRHQHREAQQSFEQALAVDRRFGEAHGGLAATLALQNRLDEAESAIKLARRLAPNGFGAEFAEAVVLIQRGQPRNGADIYQKALERSLPGNSLLPLLEQLRLYALKRSGASHTVH